MENSLWSGLTVPDPTSQSIGIDELRTYLSALPPHLIDATVGSEARLTTLINLGSPELTAQTLQGANNELTSQATEYAAHIRDFCNASTPEQVRAIIGSESNRPFYDYTDYRKSPPLALRDTLAALSAGYETQQTTNAVDTVNKALLDFDAQRYTELSRQLEHEAREKLKSIGAQYTSMCSSLVSKYSHNPALIRSTIDSPAMEVFANNEHDTFIELYSRLATLGNFAAEDCPAMLSRLTALILENRDHEKHTATARHKATTLILAHDPEDFKETAENICFEDGSPRIACRNNFYTLAYDAILEIKESTRLTGQQKLMEHIEAISNTDLVLAQHIARRELAQSAILSDTKAQKLLGVLDTAIHDPLAGRPYVNEPVFLEADFEEIKIATIQLLFKHVPTKFYDQLLAIIPQNQRIETVKYMLPTIIERLSSGDAHDIAKAQEWIGFCLPEISFPNLKRSCEHHLQLYELTGNECSLETIQQLTNVIAALPESESHLWMSSIMLRLYYAGSAQSNMQLIDSADQLLAWRHRSLDLVNQDRALADMVALHVGRNELEAAMDYAEVIGATIPDPIVRQFNSYTVQEPSNYIRAVGSVVEKLVQNNQHDTAARLVLSHLLDERNNPGSLFYGIDAARYILGLRTEIATIRKEWT